VLDRAVICELQSAVRSVKVDPRIAGYIVDLAEATRHHGYLKMGCSPRGTLMLFRMAQAHAFFSRRDYAIPEDVKAVAVCTLAHRLALDTKAKYSGIAKEDVVREILSKVPVGV
jgi:MoxR-like ATPase